MDGEDGFTLIEMVASLAIVALMAGVALPVLRRGPRPADVDAFAVRVAAVLKADRIAAIRYGRPVVTSLSAKAASVTSGSGLGTAYAPAGVALDAILADRCAGAKMGAGVAFFPSGLSCGGVIGIAGPGRRAQVRVNWITGGVDVVSAGN